MATKAIVVPDAFLIGTNNVITFNTLTDTDGADVLGATFSGVLYDTLGVAVTGATSITFTQIGATSSYVGELPAAAAMVRGSVYELRAVASKGGKQLTLNIRKPAMYVGD